MADIDERVLRMSFDNEGFESGVNDTLKALQQLNSSLSNFGNQSFTSPFSSLQSSVNSLDFSSINSAIETIENRFSSFGIASARIIENLADQVFGLGENIISALTIDPVKLGWGEYNQLIDISRLMAANTEASMEQINAFTDRLNEYADKTKYNFLEMAEGAKQFVQATGSLDYTFQNGTVIDLEKLVEGATNYVAYSGGSNANLRNVLEVFSRALQTGEFSQEGMRRLTRNGAAGKLFQDLLTQAVKNMGRTELMEQAIDKAGSFLGALNKQKAGKYAGWANGDVVAEMLRLLSDQSTIYGRKGYANATEATTFKEVMDQSVEAVQSGWTRIWRSIVGDLEEAKSIWRVVNNALNGPEGFLSSYSSWFGELFEGWRELGGRTELIQGLFDAFQGLYNILISVKNAFADVFEALTPFTLKDISSGFSEGASKFKTWTEGLRAQWGDFIGGYEFWDKYNPSFEEVTEELTDAFDYDEYLARIDDYISSYMPDIVSWLNQYTNDPNNYDKDGNFNASKAAKAIANLDWDSFTDDKALKSQLKAAEAYVQTLFTGDDSGLRRSYYAQGIMNEDYFSTQGYDDTKREAYLAILRELGHDTYALQDSIRESLRVFQTTTKDNSFTTHEITPLIVKGVDYTADDVVEIYNTQLSLRTVLTSILKIVKSITDAAKNIHTFVIKPLTTSIIQNAFYTISEVLGRFAQRFSSFFESFKNMNYLERFIYWLMETIGQNTKISAFFDDITSVLLAITDKLWDFIDTIQFLFRVVTNNPVIDSIRGMFSSLWDNIISPFISNNVKGGALTGGVFGAILGGLKGFFSGGPIGMIIEAFKGLTSGVAKGSIFGLVLDGFKYIINSGPKVQNLLYNISNIFKQLYESFAKGFQSDKNPFKLLANGFKAAGSGISDILNGKADPLNMINSFLTSETVTEFIDKLKKPFEDFGEFVSGIWKFIAESLDQYFRSMGTKWSIYMGKADNNPLLAFVNIVKDSKVYKIVKNFFDIIIDGLKAFKDGLFGIATDNPVTNFISGIDWSKLSLFDKVTIGMSKLSEILDSFKKSDQFSSIKKHLEDLGEGIREFVKTITSGDLLGILFNALEFIGGIGSSFFGSVGTTIGNGVDAFGENVGKPLSEKVRALRESFDAFLESDKFKALKENFYSFGQFLSGSFTTGLRVAGEAVSTLFGLITNTKVAGFFADLKDTVVDFIASFVEGLTGTEIGSTLSTTKEKIIGIFEALGEKLAEFKISDTYDQVKSFAELLGTKVHDAITGIIDLIGKIAEFKNPLDGIKEQFNSLFGAKGSTDSVNGVEETVETLKETIKDAPKPKDSKGLLSFLGSAVDFVLGVQTVSASELDSNLEEPLNEIKEAGNTANDAAEPAEEGKKSVDTISKFVNSLGSAAKVIGTVGAALAGLGIAGFVINALSLFKGFVNIAGIINGTSGYLNAATFVKYAKSIAIIGATIGGLALVFDNLDSKKNSLLKALTVTTGILLIVVTIIDVFSDEGIKVEKALVSKPLEALNAAMEAIGEGIKNFMSKLGWVALLGGFAAAIGVVAYAIYQLAKIELDDLMPAALTILGIAAGLLAFMFALAGLAKVTKTIDMAEMAGVGIALAGLAIGVGVIAHSLIPLRDAFQEVLSSSSADKWDAFIVTFVTIIGIIIALCAAAYLLTKAVGRNPVDIAAMVSAGISVLAISAGIKIMMSSIIELQQSLSKNKINEDDIAAIILILAGVIVSLGGFVRLAQGKAVALRSSVALFAVVAAIRIALDGVIQISKYCNDAANKIDSKEDYEVINNALVSIGLIAAALGGSIWLMKGPAVKARTIVALGTLVAAIAIVLEEVKSAMKIIQDDKADTYTEALHSIAKILIALAAAIKIIQVQKIGKVEFSSGLGGALGAIALMASVYMALGAIKDMGDMDFEKYKGAFIAVGKVLIAIVVAMAGLSKFADKVSAGTIIGMVVLVSSCVGSILMLKVFIKEGEDVEQIGNAMSKMMGTMGIIFAVLSFINSKTQGIAAELKNTSNFDQAFEQLVTIGVMVLMSSVSLVEVANAIDVDKLDEIDTVAKALSTFILSLSGVAWIGAQIGPMAQTATAGLQTIGMVVGVVSLIIGLISEFYANDFLGFKTGLMDNVGETLIDFAAFLGEFVATFKSNSMVKDTEDLQEGAVNISDAMNKISTNLVDIDLDKINNMVGVIEAFEKLRKTLSMYGETGATTDTFTVFGRDLVQFIPNFVEFAESILALQSETGVDLDFVGSVVEAVNKISGIKISSGGIIDGFTGKASISEIGGILGSLGEGLYSLYSYASLMGDAGAIDNVVTAIERINGIFDTDIEETDCTKIYDVADMIERSATAVTNAVQKINVSEEDRGKFNTLLLIMKSAATLATAMAGFDGVSAENMETFFKSWDMDAMVKSLEEGAGATGSIQASVDKILSSIGTAFTEKIETIKAHGRNIGIGIKVGLNDYIDDGPFLSSVAYLITGLGKAIATYSDQIRKVGADLGKLLQEGFNKEEQIQSPSQVMFEAGVFLIMGLIDGIESMQTPLQQAVQAIADIVNETYNKNLAISDSFTGEAKTAFEQAQAIKTAYDTIAPSAKKAISSFSLGDTISGAFEAFKNSKFNPMNLLTNKSSGSSNIFGLSSSVFGEVKHRPRATIESLNDQLLSVINNAVNEKGVSVLNDVPQEVLDSVRGWSEGLYQDFMNKMSFGEELTKTEENLFQEVTGFFTSFEEQKNQVFKNNGWNFDYTDLSKLFKSSGSGSFLTDAIEWLGMGDLVSTFTSFKEFGGDSENLTQFLSELTGQNFLSTDVNKLLSGDFITQILEGMGISGLNGDMFSAIIKQTDSIEDLTRALNVNGFNFNDSDTVDMLSVLGSAFDQSGAETVANPIFEKIKELLGDEMSGIWTDEYYSEAGSLMGEALGEEFSGSATAAVEQVDERITEMANRVIRGDFGNNPDRERVLESMGYSFGVIQNEVNRLLNCNYRYAVSNEDVQRTLEALGGTAEDVVEILTDVDDIGTSSVTHTADDLKKELHDLKRSSKGMTGISTPSDDAIIQYEDSLGGLQENLTLTEEDMRQASGRINLTMTKLFNDLYNTTRTGSAAAREEMKKSAVDTINETLASIGSDAQVDAIRTSYDEANKLVWLTAVDSDMSILARACFENGQIVSKSYSAGLKSGFEGEEPETYNLTKSYIEGAVGNAVQGAADTVAERSMSEAGNRINLEMTRLFEGLYNNSGATAVSSDNSELERTTIENINSILDSVGADVDVDRLQPVFDEAFNLVSVNATSATGDTIATITLENGKTVAKSFTDGIKSGATNEQSGTYTFIHNFVRSAVVDAARNAVDSHSPSMEFYGIATDCVSGLMLGFEAMAKPAQVTAGDFMDGVTETVVRASKAMSVAADEGFSYTPTISPVVSSSIEGYPELQNMLNGSSTIAVDIASISGFDRLNEIADTFTRNETTNAAILERMDTLQSEIAGLNDSIAQMKIVLNDDTLVGKIAPKINRQFSTIQNRRERGI